VLLELVLLPPPPQAAIKSAAATAIEVNMENLIGHLLFSGGIPEETLATDRVCLRLDRAYLSR
jgi:hypothetical protein